MLAAVKLGTSSWRLLAHTPTHASQWMRVVASTPPPSCAPHDQQTIEIPDSLRLTCSCDTDEVQRSIAVPVKRPSAEARAIHSHGPAPPAEITRRRQAWFVLSAHQSITSGAPSSSAPLERAIGGHESGQPELPASLYSCGLKYFGVCAYGAPAFFRLLPTAFVDVLSRLRLPNPARPARLRFAPRAGQLRRGDLQTCPASFLLFYSPSAQIFGPAHASAIIVSVGFLVGVPPA